MNIDLVAEVTDLVCKHLSIPPETVTLEASFTADLGADSLDIVELIMAIEEAFEVEISEEEAATIRTVRDAVELIRARVESTGTREG